MPPRFHITTLGCKINQYESQALREAWQGQGFSETHDPAEAELVLLNTCAVTANAVRDLRQALRRLQREAPQARLLVTGCAAALLEAELGTLPDQVQVVPQADKARLLRPLEAPVAEPEPAPPFALRISSYDRARAVLKVQDGCSHGCSYCIVPLTRGPSRSRAPEEVLAEARRLLQGGLRELVLSGVNLRQYRHEGWDFWDLLQALDRELAPDWHGVARLRLSSLEPAQLTPRGLEVLAASRLLCPHLHLSLQSGSPGVLARMNRRHYGPAEVVAGVAGLQSFWPRFGLGADILVGFPGESEAEFAQTLDLVRALPLSYAHVFPYSRRPGTRAADLAEQLPRPLRKERAAVLRALVAQKRGAFLRELAATPELLVLVETLQPESGAEGRSAEYARVELQGALPSERQRCLVPVRPLGVRGDRLLAAALPGGGA